MSYKELKEKPEEEKSVDTEQPTRSYLIAYAEIISTLVMTAMMCGTLIMTTSMWVSERKAEMAFLRGVNP